LHFKPKSPDSNLRASTYDMYDPCEFARRAVDDEFSRTGLFGDGVYDIILTARVRVKTFVNIYQHTTLNFRPMIDLVTFGVTGNTMGV
jgi:hypothetical protein